MEASRLGSPNETRQAVTPVSRSGDQSERAGRDAVETTCWNRRQTLSYRLKYPSNGVTGIRLCRTDFYGEYTYSKGCCQTQLEYMTLLCRRSTLKGIAAGAISLQFLGVATADTATQYIVTVANRDVSNRVEGAGFTVHRELADGEVLQVTGPETDRDELEAVRGVQEVAQNAYFGLEGPELEEFDTSDFDPPGFWDWQWDKHVTKVRDAHGTATGDRATVAILDTGIDPDHVDLAANVNEDSSALFSSGNPIDNHPWDNHGHGTHVAGTAAATGDVGVIGTAPDADLVSLKVFWFEDPEGHEDEDEPFLTTTTADILAAIDAAAAIGADAANMSLGTSPLPPEFNQTGMRVAYERVIQHATRQGTVVVASSGNSAANLQQGGFFTVPNSTAGALSVSATAPNDELTFYSNFGTNEIDVGAPGGGYETLEKTLEEDPKEVEWPFPLNLVFSTVPGNEYAWFAGTSMAAPQVTGLVALVRELEPDTTAKQVEQAIKHGADLVHGESNPELGAGRINAENTVERLK